MTPANLAHARQISDAVEGAKGCDPLVIEGTPAEKLELVQIERRRLYEANLKPATVRKELAWLTKEAP